MVSAKSRAETVAMLVPTPLRVVMEIWYAFLWERRTDSRVWSLREWVLHGLLMITFKLSWESNERKRMRGSDDFNHSNPFDIHLRTQNQISLCVLYWVCMQISFRNSSLRWIDIKAQSSDSIRIAISLAFSPPLSLQCKIFYDDDDDHNANSIWDVGHMTRMMMLILFLLRLLSLVKGIPPTDTGKGLNRKWGCRIHSQALLFFSIPKLDKPSKESEGEGVSETALHWTKKGLNWSNPIYMLIKFE